MKLINKNKKNLLIILLISVAALFAFISLSLPAVQAGCAISVPTATVTIKPLANAASCTQTYYGCWTTRGDSCVNGRTRYGDSCGTKSYISCNCNSGYFWTGSQCQKINAPTVTATYSPNAPSSGQSVSIEANAQAVNTEGYAEAYLTKIDIFADSSLKNTCVLGTTGYVCRGTGKWERCFLATTYPKTGTCQFSSTFSTGSHNYYATAADTNSFVGQSTTNSFNVAAPIDTSSDTNNCGSIGNVCGSGQTCQSGTCVAPVPPAPPGPAFDFSISVDPANGAANKGDSKDVNASLALVSGSAAAATLTAENLPVGATASFTPTSCSPNCYSNVTIATTAATPVGWQLITIKGTSGSLVKTATYNLTVLGTSTTCGNLVCEYPETQSTCSADCKTTANIPSPVAPGDIVAVSVEFYDFRYLANQKVQIDLKINPENLAWTPANGCFFGGKIMGPAASGSVIQWPAGTVSQDGHFKITTTCAIPGTIAAGAHTLVATPTIF